MVRHALASDLGSFTLSQELGIANWKKICGDTVAYLVDAEALWQQASMSVGRGKNDFGEIANTYRKAIEAELRRRFSEVYQSQPFIDYYQSSHKGQKPPVYFQSGSMLHALKRYERLPFPLQSEIQATGVRLHMQPDLVERLMQISSLLNLGSHDSFDINKLEEIRSKLHKDELLKNLFDSLPPHVV